MGCGPRVLLAASLRNSARTLGAIWLWLSAHQLPLLSLPVAWGRRQWVTHHPDGAVELSSPSCAGWLYIQFASEPFSLPSPPLNSMHVYICASQLIWKKCFKKGKELSLSSGSHFQSLACLSRKKNHIVLDTKQKQKPRFKFPVDNIGLHNLHKPMIRLIIK